MRESISEKQTSPLLNGTPLALLAKLRQLGRRAVRKLLISTALLEHKEGSPPPPGRVLMGDLRRLKPLASDFGYSRGQPIDRYYIENFLSRHADDVQGRVLEIKDDEYTQQFGGNRVTQGDILDIDPDNPRANIVGDLADVSQVPADTYDCAIITQTLLLIYDVKAALRTLYRILKPGGVCLITVPGITSVYEDLADTWYWSFTVASMQQLLEETFPGATLTVESHGNMLAAIALLAGLATEELHTEELDYHDLRYQVTISARAVKPAQ